MSAYVMSLAAQARNAKQMVFDWNKAAQLIKERQPKSAGAGLRSDWEYTGATIYQDGQPTLDAGPYLSSNWAVPELDLDGDVVECFIFADDNPNGWHSGTVWPESALEILNSK